MKACAFSLPQCSVQGSKPSIRRKREGRGSGRDQNAPTVDLAIVGGGTLFLLMVLTVKPLKNERKGALSVQRVSPTKLWEMGVKAFVGCGGNIVHAFVI